MSKPKKIKVFSGRHIAIEACFYPWGELSDITVYRETRIMSRSNIDKFLEELRELLLDVKNAIARVEWLKQKLKEGKVYIAWA